MMKPLKSQIRVHVDYRPCDRIYKHVDRQVLISVFYHTEFLFWYQVRERIYSRVWTKINETFQ